MSERRRALLAAVVALLAAGVTGLVIGLAEDDEPPALPPQSRANVDLKTGEPVPPDPIREGFGPRERPPRSPAAQADEGLEEGPSGPPPESEDERAAAAAVRAYVSGLSERDGAAVCGAFAPGALDSIDFPREGLGCADRVQRSLGYRDPRGLPVWRDSRLGGAISAQVDGAAARVTVTVITTYADDREPSVEDDLVYLTRAGDGWLIVKPSTTIYRAIGVAELPPGVISPP